MKTVFSVRFATSQRTLRQAAASVARPSSFPEHCTQHLISASGATAPNCLWASVLSLVSHVSVSRICPKVLASLLYPYQLVKGFIGMLYCWRVGNPAQCGSVEIRLCGHLRNRALCICWPSSYQPSFSTQLSLPLSLILQLDVINSVI